MNDSRNRNIEKDHDTSIMNMKKLDSVADNCKEVKAVVKSQDTRLWHKERNGKGGNNNAEVLQEIDSKEVGALKISLNNNE